MHGWRTWVGITGVAWATLGGCSATVVTSYGDGGRGEGGDATVPCVDAGPPLPVSATVRVDGRASMVADRLHVTGRVNGVDGYFIARYQDGALWLPASPSALEGEAHWVSVGGVTYARVRGGDGDSPLLAERLDAGAADAPVVTSSTELDGEIPEAYRGTVSAFDERLYFCRETVDQGPELATLDATGKLIVPSHNGCSAFYHASAAQAGLMVSWTLGVGSDSGSVNVSNLVEDGRSLVNFSFAPNGAHHYGGINGGATDGARVVISTDSDDWMLVFGAEGEFGLDGPYVRFSPAGPKRLLAVVDELAYFVTADAVVAYDLHDVQAPVLLGEEAPASFDPTAVTWLATVSDALLLRDADGALWSVPRALDGPAVPTPTYLGEPATTPAPCSD